LESDDVNTYTGVHARIEYANPSVRDNGFTSELIWLGPIDLKGNYVEMGWRKTGPNGNVKAYWAYYTDDGTFHFIDLGTINSAHDYRLEYHPDDDSYHAYLDNNEVQSSPVHLSSKGGWASAGGEVSDGVCDVHNAMGVNGFTDLTYKVNTGGSITGYYTWNSQWKYFEDYQYHFTILSQNSFQNSGYNP